MINSSMDLACLQEGFSSLVKNADPKQLGPFFVWLDLKVAQFKISGTFSPEKNNKSMLEKVTKNLFENSPTTTTTTTTNTLFPSIVHSGIHNLTPTYLSTPIRDNRAYFEQLKKPISFSESKLSLYQLNWDAFDPRGGFRSNLDSSFGLRGPLFPHFLHDAPAEPLDFSKVDKKKQHQINISNSDSSSGASESVQSVLTVKPNKEGVRSLLREVLSRPRETPLCSTPVKTSPPVKEERSEPPADVLVVMPEEPPPTNDSRQEERHICTLCQKEFNYKSSYRRHMKIHQGLYSHTCCICTRKFTRKEHFVRHKCDRRPNKPNRRSSVLDISMNSEPDSSSLVRMDELDIDPSIKMNPIKVGSPPMGSVKVDSSIGYGNSSQTISDPANISVVKNNGENDAWHHTSSGEETQKISGSKNSPQSHPDDELNKNLESRRKSSTPRKFVPQFLMKTSTSDNEESNTTPIQKSENDSVKVQPESKDLALNQDHLKVKNETPKDCGVLMPVVKEEEQQQQHLDLQTGSYVVSTSRAADKEEALAIKIKKQAKYLKLKNEAKIVDGTLRFECPQCSKVFFRSSNFSRHMRIHRGVYSYVCQACRRGFFRKEHFQKHKCHRRGQDSHSDAMTGQNLMPSITDVMNYPYFSGNNLNTNNTE